MRKKIVALILERDGKILVEKRKASKATCPNDIVFPSGKVEDGETNEQALRREVHEELGIEIHNPKLVHQEDFDCEEKQEIYWYSCDNWDGEIQNNEAEELLWIDPSESNMLTYQVSKNALSAYSRSK